jgi:hypothetical protein
VIRFIFNLLIVLLLVRLLLPVVRRAIRALNRSSQSVGAPGGKRRERPSELSPYEIEDAEYDDVGKPGSKGRAPRAG